MAQVLKEEVRNNIVPRFDDDGILYIGVEDFLLDERMLDLQKQQRQIL